MNFEPTARNAADLKALTDTLASVPIGGTISYAELSEAIGRDARKCRYLLLKAMNDLNKEQGAAFAAVRGMGYRRVGVDKAAQFGETRRASFRRVSRRTMKQMQNMVAKTNDVPADVHRKVSQELSALGIIELVSSRKAVEALPLRTKPVPTGIAMRRMLEGLGVLEKDEDGG